ncbi:MAG: tryptophanase [Flexilinea sp.]
MEVKLSDGRTIPMEMHKIKIVQRTNLPTADERIKAIREAGYNTFLMRSQDVFLDMLTDSGTNAMSDNQQSAMLVADDAYAGSESFHKLEESVQDVFGLKYVIPAHQGRACEHLLARVYVKPDTFVITNYHFTTTKAHIRLCGGEVLELICEKARETASSEPFKGNMDIDLLRKTINQYGKDRIAYIRMEATTNLIGGQPFSMQNLKEVSDIAKEFGIMIMLDCSLISENAYFIRTRESGFADTSIKDIIQEMIGQVDLIYMSGRKSTMARGGLIATNSTKIYREILPLVPVYEGFITYGGMSTKEIESIAVGMREMVELNIAGSGAEFIKYFVNRLCEFGVPVVTPPGGLGCHVDAKKFLPHIPWNEYPAGALASAVYLVSGCRGMERGSLSMDRDAEGKEEQSDMELLRLAVPRRTFTMSQLEYTADRLAWLYKNRSLIHGLRWVEEPPVLRFFIGRLESIGGWENELIKAYKSDFGEI